jgi:hypothetical protein
MCCEPREKLGVVRWGCAHWSFPAETTGVLLTLCMTEFITRSVMSTLSLRAERTYSIISHTLVRLSTFHPKMKHERHVHSVVRT